MFLLVVAALIIVIVLYGQLREKKQKAGVKGWVMSQDLDCRSTQVYRNHRLGISSKPDVVEDKKIIEYKSASAKNEARYPDILQLAAEMITTGRSEAELRYGNGKRFIFSKDMPLIRSAMAKTEKIVRRMQWHLRLGVPPKGAPSVGKCRNCIFKPECRYSIQ